MVLRRLFFLGFLVATSCTPAAPGTEANLHLTVKPPYDALAAGTPGIWLDVCADKQCAAVDSSIPLKCILQKTRDPDLVNITECSEHATKSTDTSEFALLDHPVHLRLRMDTLKSPPFAFGGAKSNVAYEFTVSWNAEALKVSKH